MALSQGQLPPGLIAPAWALRELNPLDYEDQAERFLRAPLHESDPESVFLRAGWRHPLDSAGPTHLIDGIQNRSDAPSDRVHICEAYLCPLEGLPHGRCQGIYNCRSNGIHPCSPGHPDPFDYFNIAAVATALVSYD